MSRFHVALSSRLCCCSQFSPVPCAARYFSSRLANEATRNLAFIRVLSCIFPFCCVKWVLSGTAVGHFIGAEGTDCCAFIWVVAWVLSVVVYLPFLLVSLKGCVLWLCLFLDIFLALFITWAGAQHFSAPIKDSKHHALPHSLTRIFTGQLLCG